MFYSRTLIKKNYLKVLVIYAGFRIEFIPLL